MASVFKATILTSSLFSLLHIILHTFSSCPLTWLSTWKNLSNLLSTLLGCYKLRVCLWLRVVYRLAIYPCLPFHCEHWSIEHSKCNCRWHELKEESNTTCRVHVRYRFLLSVLWISVRNWVLALPPLLIYVSHVRVRFQFNSLTNSCIYAKLDW